MIVTGNTTRACKIALEARAEFSAYVKLGDFASRDSDAILLIMTVSGTLPQVIEKLSFISFWLSTGVSRVEVLAAR